MNIFVLDRDPRAAARAHCDKHVIKMVTESAQILSTVARSRGVDDPDLYCKTHVNHPCVKWAAETQANYIWLYSLLHELVQEYDNRYGQKGSFRRVRTMMRALFLAASSVPSGKLTPFAQVMPEQYRGEDAVEAYRLYYIMEKSNLLRYTHRNPPSWLAAIL